MPEHGYGVVVCSLSLLLCSHPGRRQAETPLITPVQKSRPTSAIARDRTAAQKHVARTEEILATAGGCGTMEVMPLLGPVQTRRVALARAVHAPRAWTA